MKAPIRKTADLEALPEKLRSKADEPLAGRVVPQWDIMPYGKHKGWLITEIPTDYLRWCVNNWERKADGLYEALEAELWTRKD